LSKSHGTQRPTALTLHSLALASTRRAPKDTPIVRQLRRASSWSTLVAPASHSIPRSTETPHARECLTGLTPVVVRRASASLSASIRSPSTPRFEHPSRRSEEHRYEHPSRGTSGRPNALAVAHFQPPKGPSTVGTALVMARAIRPRVPGTLANLQSTSEDINRRIARVTRADKHQVPRDHPPAQPRTTFPPLPVTRSRRSNRPQPQRTSPLRRASRPSAPESADNSNS
jgi:hypothetical protein